MNVLDSCKPFFRLHKHCEGKTKTLKDYNITKEDMNILIPEIRKILIFRLLFGIKTRGNGLRDISIEIIERKIYLRSINEIFVDNEKTRVLSDATIRKWFPERPLNEYIKSMYPEYANSSPRVMNQKIFQLESALEREISRVDSRYVYLAHDVCSKLQQRLS